MPAIAATYRVRCRPKEAARIARFLAVEQTVEVPEALVGPAQRVGEVVRLEELRGGARITIVYDAELAAGQLPQLLNLVYGNVSIRPRTRLEDLLLPPELLARFRGPNFGVGGLRERLGVHGRPLLCTALKPRGAPEDALVAIATEFVEGGGDLVKDDHNLVGDEEALLRRARRVRDAVAEASARTGRDCLYLPCLCAPAERLEPLLEAVLGLGLAGVLVPPMLLGLDAVRALAERHRLFVMAHPTFSGTLYADPHHGIEPGLLFGTLFRLAGVDASVFVNRGGRFRVAARDVASIARRCREPLGPIRPSFPAPGGGMGFRDIPSIARRFGADAILLVGGALLTDPAGVRDATRRYLDALRARFDGGAPR
jgi:ribulose-bisphosphate carboxylase large chain